MVGIRTWLKALFVVGSTVTVSAYPKPSPWELAALSRRQEAEKSGLTDVDIAQFALTLEHLENAFYAQGFARFGDQEFAALGLSPQSIAALKQVGKTEAIHVATLLSAIAGNNVAPVEPCEYKFDFTDAATMIATAGILEAVGVSAYLAAAPLVTSKDVLGLAASIVTVEARHQTFIRVASSKEPVPTAFDTPLGPRGVFTLAAPFIAACPEGSNLNITPFPSIQLEPGSKPLPGQAILLDGQPPEGAQFCAFLSQGQNYFVPLDNGSCNIPVHLSGEVYMMITSEQSVADTALLAGPAVLSIS